MRELVLDTETTGLDPIQGHRIVEIGCVEIENLVPTGRTYHQYIDPERDMPDEAFAVHGLSREFLGQHPPWREVFAAFLDFIGDDRLVIHNAPFDMKFINAELKAVNTPPLAMDRVVDTLTLARGLFPGAQASLDALCRRFGIDNAMRTAHGALLDSELLAAVYLELRGGRQPDLAMSPTASVASKETSRIVATAKPAPWTRSPRPRPASQSERGAHDALVGRLSDPLWRRAS